MQVVEHVLRGTQEDWTSQAWRETLASPKAMILRFCPLISRGDGSFEVEIGRENHLNSMGLSCTTRHAKLI